MDAQITVTLKELRELHELAFYSRQASKADDSKTGERIEILACKWDDRLHNLLKGD